jgi:hypothetical protein
MTIGGAGSPGAHTSLCGLTNLTANQDAAANNEDLPSNHTAAFASARSGFTLVHNNWLDQLGPRSLIYPQLRNRYRSVFNSCSKVEIRWFNPARHHYSDYLSLHVRNALMRRHETEDIFPF